MDPDILSRVPPHDAKAEMGILGSALLLSDTLDDVVMLVRPDSFYAAANGKIFTHLLALHEEGKRADMDLLVARLKKAGEFEAVGGTAYLAEVMQSVAVPHHAVYYAEIVRDKAMMLNLGLAAVDILQAVYDPTVNTRDCMDKAERSVYAVRDTESDNEAVPIMGIMAEAIASIDKRMESGAVGLPTGFVELDRLTGGLHDGELTLLAARPSVGKTALALNITEHVSIDQDRPVLFASLEMSGGELAGRLLSARGQIDGYRIRNGHLTADDMRALTEAASEISQHPLWIDDNPNRTITEIAAVARRAKRKSDLALLVVDYLQLIIPENRREQRHEQVAYIGRRLKGLARDLSIPVLCVAQLNRRAEETDRPKLSHLRECLAVDSTLLFTSAGVQGNMVSRMSLYTWNKRSIAMESSTNVPKRSANTIMVKLRSGRFIQCTPKHNVLTDRGWCEAAKLTEEHAIACAHVIDEPEGMVTIPHARWMGWMLGNGSMLGLGSPSFICSDGDLASVFCETTTRLFGLTARVHTYDGPTVWQYDITAGYHTPKPNACKTWLKLHDMWGRKAPQKVIPEWFLGQADNASIAEIVGGLIDTDGSVPQFAKQRGTTIKYATTSHNMAFQVLWCLSRLGIWGRIDNGVMSDKATTPCYTISIADGVEVAKFRERIRLTGKKHKLLHQGTLSLKGSNHGNRLGPWAGRALVAHSRLCGITQEKLGYRDQGKRIHRDELRRRLDLIGTASPTLEGLTNPAIFWDRLRDITPAGKAVVFDRTVPGAANYIANGIIVHNSGSLEQDADVVMFVHREEFGKKAEEVAEKNLRGKAEVILAKQRNGPTGVVKLAWREQVTRFENLAPDPYAEFEPYDGRNRDLDY